MLFITAWNNAPAQKFWSDKFQYRVNDDGQTVTLISADKESQLASSVIIPEKVSNDNTEYTVTSIGDSVFWCCSLASVNLPNSVTSIGSYAFRSCLNLTSIDIPNSVTSIGDYAFSVCRSLTSINIPNSVTSIGVHTFSRCYKLSSITIPNSVRSIGLMAFMECNELTSITIPGSVKHIDENVFFGCPKLSYIKLEHESSDFELDKNWLFGIEGKIKIIVYENLKNVDLHAGDHTIEYVHNLQHTPAVDATCTTNGNTGYYTCKYCHKYFSDAEGQHEIAENSWVIPAHHFCTLVGATAETCTTAGSDAYYDCERCDKYFSDAEGLHEIAENSWVRPALGHDWEDIYDEEHYTWTHHCKHDAAHDIHRKQLCFEAKEDNSELGWGELSYEKIYNLQYSLNWSNEWTNLEAGEYVKLNTGDKIWVRCNTSQSFEMGTFNMNGKFEASGSIMSMINNQPDLTVIPYEKCFFQMFNQRSCLTKAPALPATTLTKGCYSSMFQNSGLVTAPVLPAETLAENCYESMFSGCSDLVSAPVLPAETLVKGCYRSMFASCENLASLTLNAKDVSAEGCIDGFLDNNRFLNPVKGILHITDELAFSNVNLQLPSNWSSDKVGIHAKEDPDNKGDYYATFYKGEGEYTVPEGTKAYTGVIEGGVLEMTAEANNIIPAGEGVLLKGNTADYILTLSDTNKPQTPGNALRGSDKDVNAPEGVYIFTYGQKGLGFYKYAVDGVLSANKAYLQTVIGSAKAYPMVFGDGVTGMNNVLAPSKGNGAIYNLQGVRLNKLQKGINIVNGKKVFVK